MKKFKQQAAQGDILIRRIDALPEGLEKLEPKDNQHIVAHSETGHHHAFAEKGVNLFHAANDSMNLYVVIDEQADLIHNRSFDTHETIRFDAGVYEIRRQREYTPEGWRRVED